MAYPLWPGLTNLAANKICPSMKGEVLAAGGTDQRPRSVGSPRIRPRALPCPGGDGAGGEMGSPGSAASVAAGPRPIGFRRSARELLLRRTATPVLLPRWWLGVSGQCAPGASWQPLRTGRRARLL